MALLAFENLVKTVADAIVTVNPSILLQAPTGADAEAVRTYWYTNPHEFVREWLLTQAALLPTLYALSGRNWVVRLPGHPPPVSSADVWAGKLTDDKQRTMAASPAVKRGRSPATLGSKVLSGLEKLMIASLPIVLGALAYYKGSTGRLAYFFQPCHLQTSLLLGLAAFSRRPDGNGAKLFQLFLASWYGPMLALATPDLRDQNGFLEVPMFFVEHGVLLALPAVWIAQRKFDLFSGFRPWAFCYLLFWLLHLDVFVPASLVAGRNINYMMVPPQVSLLRGEGPAGDLPYRAVMGAACGVLTFAMYLVTRTVSWISGADSEFASECAADAAEAAAMKGAVPIVTLPTAAARGRKPAAASTAGAALAPHVPSEGEVLTRSNVGAFDASLAGTMAEGVHSDSMIRAAAAGAVARAAVARTGVSLKAVRIGYAHTAAGLISIATSPVAAPAAAAATAKKAKQQPAAAAAAAPVPAPAAAAAAQPEPEAASAPSRRASAASSTGRKRAASAAKSPSAAARRKR